MQKTKIFFDSEFTGLHQNTTLISIGMVSDCGKQFYAEFNDYASEQCDEWILENVIAHTRWLSCSQKKSINQKQGDLSLYFGDTDYIRQALIEWLNQFEEIEVWADCLAYDWVLFCQLFGGALSVPDHIFYMPFDLVTLFKLKGFDPNCNRIDFVGDNRLTQHNALDDALVTKLCHDKLLA